MGLTDVLFGRKRLKGAKLDKLFALATAQVTLESELSLKPAGVAAVVFKPLSAGEFARAEQEIDELLSVAAQSSGSQVRRRSDTFGYEWLVVRDADFEDLIATVHLVASELAARGFGDRLWAALFPFEGDGARVYLIYGFKRGTFWPFVPTGTEQERDNPEELRLRNELQGELPIEPDLSRWLGLFDPPLG
jgi:hypothetical protein